MNANKPMWFKWTTPNSIMHELTAWNDYILDLNLVHHDAAWSMAHAAMLHKNNYLSSSDIDLIKKELKRIYDEGIHWSFIIEKSFEDVHSAIEARLIENLGESWKKIHLWRSRNDQILLCMRLYTREIVLEWLDYLHVLMGSMRERIVKDGNIMMSWYTHMQRWMPSSIWMWLQAFYEEGVELLRRGYHLLDELNVCPLGGAAGFWVPLDTDPDYVSHLLGFSRRHLNPMNGNNSRWRYELRAVTFAKEIASMLEKFSVDIMLWQTTEYNFWTLPDEYSTWSSIMPQKRNLDIAELLRARWSKIQWAFTELSSVLAKLPSSYHRDFQYSKEPLIRTNEELIAMIKMGDLIVKNLILKKESLESSVTPELYTTYAAFHLVSNWVPFRDAYKEIWESWKNWTFKHEAFTDDYQLIQNRIINAMEVLEGEANAIFENIAQFKNNQCEKIRALFL